MRYPHIAVLADAVITPTANGYLTGTIAAPIDLPLDHAGPGILFFGQECTSASTAGGSRFVFCYTSRDGNPMTASGSGMNHTGVSASGSGCLPVNLASNSTIGYILSCTATMSSTAYPKIRYWITYLGGDSTVGMLQN